MSKWTPRPRPRKKGSTRRDFLKHSAAASALLGASRLLPLGCGGGGGGSGGSSPNKAARTYYFDFTGADQSQDFYLATGVEQHRLKPMTPDALAQARAENPFVRALPPTVLTHYGKDIPMPADGVQICFVRGFPKGRRTGSWTMPLMFFHFPRPSVEKARTRRGESATNGVTSFAAAKLRLYGVDPLSTEGQEATADAAHEDDVKTVLDQAAGMVGSHPEMLSGDPDSAAHIQKSIIGPLPTTQVLAIKIMQQGTATESGGWATLKPIIDPTTNQPYLNSHGQPQCLQVWSNETQTFTGAAIVPSLPLVKNDTTLGANITDLEPDDLNTALQGKVWSIRDGVPTAQAGSQAAPGDAFDYTFSNLSPGPGFKATVTSVDSTSGNVTFEVRNSFVRYLGVYVRYVDADGNAISYDSLPAATQKLLPDWAHSFSSDTDRMVAMSSPEYNILGIPVKSDKVEVTINIPEAASKVILLAGGLGYGPKSYPDTLTPGIAMTSLVCLAVPVLFLVCNAAASFSGFLGDLSELDAKVAIGEGITIVGEFIFNEFAFDGDPSTWWEYAEQLSEGFLGVEAPVVLELIFKAIGSQAALDAIPVLSLILGAVSCLGLIAQIDETASECAASPWTFAYELTLSHDIAVTINRDPNDFEFPAVADHYVVTALFDTSTTYTSGEVAMPGTTQSDPLTYTFLGVPYGGNVNVSVGFYSKKPDNWLAGQGSTGVIPNTVDSATITIKEAEVPLTINTQYSHREKIVLDASGNHIWQATTSPPSATQGSLSCENVAGDLCGLIGITVSEQFAAVGYSFKSLSSGIRSCESGSSGQLHQFASLSIKPPPQAGYLAPTCGFSAPVRMVYDLMDSENNNWWLDTSGGNQLVRQVRLQQGKPPSIDGPSSNLAWGRFGNPCDTLLIHSNRKLVSINAALNKIEILDLPAAASSDADAPLALAYSATGIREGLLDGPVAAAITPTGAILVLESANQRIQAFDVSANPTPYFNGDYYVPLKAETGVTYLDMAVEYTGYIYVLSYVGTYQYRLDIYTPDGVFLTRTTGVNAARCTVDFWRNVYTLNYELLKLPNGSVPSITEPSVSQWIPSPP